MPITTDDWSYRYQEMKAKLEMELEHERAAREDFRAAYVELYTKHANKNNQLLHEYGLEGEADARDIIERMHAALMNMRDRNANLRHQLDAYDQLNAAFENVRKERDAAQERNDTLIHLNQGLEEDVRQLEDRLDGIDAGYDFGSQDDGL